MPIRLVIADDHPIVLAGLVDCFEHESDVEIVARVRNGAEALDAVRRLQPDVLLLDLRMPVMNGLDVLRELGRDRLPTRVVVLTALGDDDAVEAVCLGARGMVMKDVPPPQLVQSVRDVARGAKSLDPSVAARAVDRLIERQVGGVQRGTSGLTRRELEVARMAADGLPSKLIARKLDISEGTAKLHLHHVYEKLNVNGRFALMQYLRAQQLA